MSYCYPDALALPVSNCYRDALALPVSYRYPDVLAFPVSYCYPDVLALPMSYCYRDVIALLVSYYCPDVLALPVSYSYPDVLALPVSYCYPDVLALPVLYWYQDITLINKRCALRMNRYCSQICSSVTRKPVLPSSEVFTWCSFHFICHSHCLKKWFCRWKGSDVPYFSMQYLLTYSLGLYRLSRKFTYSSRGPTTSE
jgi:hypothetical protein